MIKDHASPAAVEFEQIVLGQILIESQCIDIVVAIPLIPAHFYIKENSVIYEAILNLYQRKEPIHILTVTKELKKTGMLDAIGGPYYITKLTNRVSSSENIEYHCRIIIQQYLRREAARITMINQEKFFNESFDIFESIEKVQQEFFTLVANTLRKSHSSVSKIVGEAIKEIHENNGKGVTGIPSGFRELDAIMYGWQKQDLVIVAARPGMGKTSFVLSSALATAKLKIPVAFFSLEMSEKQLGLKALSIESDVKLSSIRGMKLSENELSRFGAGQTGLDIPLYIDDTPALSIFEFTAKARRLVQTLGVQLIIIDYLQLMTAKGFSGNREGEISYISRNLKAVAKELDIPIIALSQLSRKVEERAKAENRPMLSDLRESGAIEQDADMVMFLYRPEYYKKYKDSEGQDLRGKSEVIIAKFRNGDPTSVYLKFVGYLTKFMDLPKEEEYNHPDITHAPIDEDNEF